MKKLLKSSICIMLSFVMVFSCTITAFAKEKATPVIFVHGIGASALYENPNTENEKELANLGCGDIVSKIFSNSDLLTQLLQLLDTGNKVDTDKLISGLSTFAKSCQMNCDKNGNAPSNIGINNYWTDSMANHKDYLKNNTTAEGAIVNQLCDSIGSKNVYMFNYNSLTDICETADKLNSYIKNVKKKTGAKKVALVGCSLGGSVLSAYMDAYKNKKDVSRYVFVNAAFMGVDVARVYAKDLKLDKKTVKSYLNNISENFDDGSLDPLISTIYSLLDARLDYAVDNFNALLNDEKTVNRIFLEVLLPLLGYTPSLWECIPYDSFDKAVKEMSAIGFLDTSGELYKKIKKYHAVQGRVKKNLNALKKQNIEVAIIANYGVSGIPVTSKASNQTDALIDTKYASAGATTAKVGKKLKASGKYVSKDKAINAKTCVLKDNTWFIKNLHHMGYEYNADTTKLIANFATGKVKCNLKAVKKKYKYSQFLKSDMNQNLSNA